MTASRLTATSCAIALLGLATTTAAAEPLRLSTPQLDAVTAGALSGAEFFASAEAGTNSTSFAFIPTFSSGSLDTNSGDLSGNQNVSSNGDSASTEFEGRFYNRTTPFSSATVGFLTGETQTTGAGTANIGANAIAEGDFAIPFAVTLPVIPGSGKTFSITVGVAVDNPLSSFNDGGL